MDNRRLNTGQLLASGILDIEPPKTDVPEDRVQTSVWIEDCTTEKVTGSVLAGEVVHCSEYYGIPYVWQDGHVFRGIMLQYRAVTEDRTFATAQEAVEWFVATAHAVAG